MRALQPGGHGGDSAGRQVNGGEITAGDFGHVCGRIGLADGHAVRGAEPCGHRAHAAASEVHSREPAIGELGDVGSATRGVHRHSEGSPLQCRSDASQAPGGKLDRPQLPSAVLDEKRRRAIRMNGQAIGAAQARSDPADGTCSQVHLGELPAARFRHQRGGGLALAKGFSRGAEPHAEPQRGGHEDSQEHTMGRTPHAAFPPAASLASRLVLDVQDPLQREIGTKQALDSEQPLELQRDLWLGQIPQTPHWVKAPTPQREAPRPPVPIANSCRPGPRPNRPCSLPGSGSLLALNPALKRSGQKP